MEWRPADSLPIDWRQGAPPSIDGRIPADATFRTFPQNTTAPYPGEAQLVDILVGAELPMASEIGRRFCSLFFQPKLYALTGGNIWLAVYLAGTRNDLLDEALIEILDEEVTTDFFIFHILDAICHHWTPVNSYWFEVLGALVAEFCSMFASSAAAAAIEYEVDDAREPTPSLPEMDLMDYDPSPKRVCSETGYMDTF